MAHKPSGSSNTQKYRGHQTQMHSNFLYPPLMASAVLQTVSILVFLLIKADHSVRKTPLFSYFHRTVWIEYMLQKTWLDAASHHLRLGETETLPTDCPLFFSWSVMMMVVKQFVNTAGPLCLLLPVSPSTPVSF